jgi:hypothetical protein
MYTFGGLSMLRCTIYFVRSRFRQVLNNAVIPSDLWISITSAVKVATAIPVAQMAKHRESSWTNIYNDAPAVPRRYENLT